MSKGMVAAIPEAEVKDFIEEISNHGVIIYSVKKLSTFRKKLYGWGKYEGSFYSVDVAPNIDVEEFSKIANKHRKTLVA